MSSKVKIFLCQRVNVNFFTFSITIVAGISVFSSRSIENHTFFPINFIVGYLLVFKQLIRRVIEIKPKIGVNYNFILILILEDYAAVCG